MDLNNPIDVAVKAILDARPEAILRLAGLNLEHGFVRLADPNINIPEHRADHVFIFLNPDGSEGEAICVEYQLYPDKRELSEWMIKCGGLAKELKQDVPLLVVYLSRGSNRTFPDRYHMGKTIRSDFGFTTVHLWEHREAIANGEHPDLAALLVLCEDQPTEETVRQEIRIIREQEYENALRLDFLSQAFRVALRYFPRRVLEVIFEEELPMALEPTIIDEWIAERKQKWIEEHEQEWLAENERRIREDEAQRVREEDAQNFALRVLTNRFGPIPEEWEGRIRRADVAWCENLVDQALQVESLSELNLDAS